MNYRMSVIVSTASKAVFTSKHGVWFDACDNYVLTLMNKKNLTINQERCAVSILVYAQKIWKILILFYQQILTILCRHA